MATRMDPAERRQLILDVAAKVFADNGYTGVSMRRIAKECGMSAPGVMHHFPTMADLLSELLTRRERSNIDYVRSTLPPDATFRDLLEALFAFYDDRPDEVRMHQLVEGESVNPDHPAHDFFRERMEIFREETRRGFEPEYENFENVAFLVHTVAEGLRAQQARDPEFGLAENWDRVADMVFAKAIPRTRG